MNILFRVPGNVITPPLGTDNLRRFRLKRGTRGYYGRSARRHRHNRSKQTPASNFVKTDSRPVININACDIPLEHPPNRIEWQCVQQHRMKFCSSRKTNKFYLLEHHLFNLKADGFLSMVWNKIRMKVVIVRPNAGYFTVNNEGCITESKVEQWATKRCR